MSAPVAELRGSGWRDACAQAWLDLYGRSSFTAVWDPDRGVDAFVADLDFPPDLQRFLTGLLVVPVASDSSSWPPRRDLHLWMDETEYRLRPGHSFTFGFER